MRPLLTSALILLCPFAVAQTPSTSPLAIAPELAAQHLRSSSPPAYPVMVLPVHVTGAVKLTVSIDTTGHVAEAKWIESDSPASGSPNDLGSSRALLGPLSQYAIAAVKTWTYTPFDHDGVPVAITTTVSLPFDFAARSSSSVPVPGYDESLQACYQSLSENTDIALQITACKKAADSADMLPANASARASIYTAAANAFSRDKQFHEALKYASKAIDSARQSDDPAAGASSGYAARANAEANLGMYEAADEDQSIAEDYLRTALKEMDETHVDEFNRTSYIRALKATLTAHAHMLAAQGNAAAAQSKTDEAAKLQ